MKFLFSPKGRISRSQWWLGQPIPTVIYVLLIILLGSISSDKLDSAGILSIGLVVVIGFGLSVWVNFCLTAKRYHDHDKSAVWFLLVFVPFIGPAWQVVELGFLPGTPGPNTYSTDDDYQNKFDDRGLDAARLDKIDALIQKKLLENRGSVPTVQDQPPLRHADRRQPGEADNFQKPSFGRRRAQF